MQLDPEVARAVQPLRAVRVRLERANKQAGTCQFVATDSADTVEASATLSVA